MGQDRKDREGGGAHVTVPARGDGPPNHPAAAGAKAETVAVLADIHGNLPALDAVLTDVWQAGPDLIVLNGDIADGPMPAQTLGRLAELAEAMERSGGDVDAFLRADREFHLASYSAAAPGETSQIIGRMWNTTQHYRREFTKLAGRQAGLGVTHLEHRLLLDCLRRGDADDAERVLVMHIRRTRLELSRHPEIFG